MKPLIYGYMRVCRDEADHEIRAHEKAMERFAHAEGYCFAAIFHESDNGRYAAFGELLEELQRAEAHHVVVPTVNHLSAHPLLRLSMLDQLQGLADATVHVAEAP